MPTYPTRSSIACIERSGGPRHRRQQRGLHLERRAAQPQRRTMGCDARHSRHGTVSDPARLRPMAARDPQAGAPMPCRKVVNVSSVSGLFGAATQVALLRRQGGARRPDAHAREGMGPLQRHRQRRRVRSHRNASDAAIRRRTAAHRRRAAAATASASASEQIEQQLALTPLQRTGTPEDAANAIYLFCQPESDFVTGEILVASGGLRM